MKMQNKNKTQTPLRQAPHVFRLPERHIIEPQVRGKPKEPSVFP